MLTLAEKGWLLLIMLPFFTFWLGMAWQYATWQLKQEKGEQNG